MPTMYFGHGGLVTQISYCVVNGVTTVMTSSENHKV